MITGPLSSYIGWDLLTHGTECTAPAWTIDIRTEDGIARDRGYAGTTHSCPDADCDHGPTHPRTTVRIVCGGCHITCVIKSETGVSQPPPRHLGYGLPPRRKAGLLLWPGRPFLAWGRLAPDVAEPHDFVVTALGVARVTEDTVVGTITQGRGARGGVCWTAAAGPSPTGEFGTGSPFRWTDVAEGLATVTAAARWIARHSSTGPEGTSDD
ncbi:hypothetical protein ACFV0R_15655 [Streptomyces sp. NPDC059578]|uniref:hypothetical protein n=1 Tax=Streptomyces sp. NPDC059578 TaxID=3346874 RepID=UPI0036A045EA